MVRGWGGGKQDIFCQSGPTLLVLPSVFGKQARRQGACDKADEHEGRGHTTNPKSAKGRDMRRICRPFIKPYEHEGRGHTTNPTSTKGGIRQTLRARRERAYDKLVDLSSNPTSTKGGGHTTNLENKPVHFSMFWDSLQAEEKAHTTKPTSTKGGDIRQTLRTPREGTYDKPLDLSSNPTSTKGGDIRQTLRARREGTYDKPLKIKSQFLNSWDSLQEDEEGHTTKPTSTNRGDIRQNLRARREGTCDKPVDLSSNPTSMKGGTYDKPYEHEERGHTTNL